KLSQAGRTVVFLFLFFFQYLSLILFDGWRLQQCSLANLQNRSNKIFRCLYRRCPPLPIPNREVKPARADGTAVTGGRVGRRPILQKPCLEYSRRGFLRYKRFLHLLVFCWKVFRPRWVYVLLGRFAGAEVSINGSDTCSVVS